MRCFIAIDLPIEIKEKISDIQKKLPEAKTNLVNSKDVHLTLRFLGDIDESKAYKIKEAIKEIQLKIKCRISKIGVFSPSFIRVIWLKIEPSERLREINGLIGKKLEELGFEQEKRWEPHATLARVKKINDKKIFLKELGKIKIEPIDFYADKIKIKKSILTKNGPIYEDL